jgi:hypothetical protein
VRPFPYLRVIFSPQRLNGTGVTGQYDRMRGGVLRDLLGGGHQTDMGAQLAHVDTAETVAEHLDRSGGGMHQRTDELEQGGLTGAVCAEQGPVLAGTDGPVDVVEDDLASGVAPHADRVQRGDLLRRTFHDTRLRPADCHVKTLAVTANFSCAVP